MSTLFHRLRRWVNKALVPVGFELRRAAPDLQDPFVVQAQLTPKPNPVIFDIGANFGDTCAIYLERFSRAELHAFEPFPANAELIRQRFSERPQLKVQEVAISDQLGTTSFNSNESSPTNSLLSTDQAGSSFWPEGYLKTKSTILVETTTLDHFCATHSVEQIDILKLDIQGAELMALRGAEGLLRKQAVGLIYLEALVVPTYVGQPMLEDYLHFLRPLGYVLLDLYAPARKGLWLLQCDLIFVRASARQESQHLGLQTSA